MTRSLLIVMAFAVAAPLFAQPPKATEAKLKIGDPAPPLAVDKWLVGKEVKGFEKGTVYVVSFTRVDSPPFALGMAALSDLSEKLGGKGLVVVGVQVPGGRKLDDKALERALELQTAEVKKSGVSYPIGWDGAAKMWDAYVGGVAGANTASFVVDKAGKLAYFGPDATAAYVAEKVLDGSWKGKADVDAMMKAKDELGEFMMELVKKIPDPSKLDDKGSKALQEELLGFEKLCKESPFLLTDPTVWSMRFGFHLFARSYDVPDEMLSARIAAATKRKSNAILTDLVYMLGGSTPLPADPNLSKLVAKYTDGCAKLMDPKKAATDEYVDWVALITLSKKHGNTEKADAYTKVILDATPADKKKEMEEAIKRRLKDSGVGK